MRHPRRSGTAGLAAAILPLCLLALPASIAAGPIEDLQGSWATAASAAPALKWSGDAGGFTVAWTPEGGTATTVQFTPAGRPNVYGGSAKEGWSIMDSMFGDDHPVNPLEGGTLYWARSAQDGVYLYRMKIEDNGSFAIDRYALRLADGALTVALDRRTAEGGGQIREHRLVRTGP
jgi:hypothetical protein